MNVLFVLTSLLAIFLGISAFDPPECPDLATKETLLKYKVDKEITPLLLGNTYVDIWRRGDTTKYIDCSLTKFTSRYLGLVPGLNSNMHNVEHEGTSLYYKDLMTENKGHSSFNSYGEFKRPEKDSVYFNEYIHVFYVDEFAWGYFSCDIDNGNLRLAVAVKKDKENDEAAVESVKKATAIMDELKHLIEYDEMKKFERKKCPEQV